MTNKQGNITVRITGDGYLSPEKFEHGWGESEVLLTIWGQPKPQGSMTALISKSTGRAFAKPSSTAVKWRNDLVTQVTELMEEYDLPIFDEGPIGVEMLFCFDRPKSHPKRRIATDLGVKYNGSDVDKLMRAVLDGITVAGLIGDDKQVVSSFGMKVYVGSPFLLEGMEEPLHTEGLVLRVFRHVGGYNAETFK